MASQGYETPNDTSIKRFHYAVIKNFWSSTTLSRPWVIYTERSGTHSLALGISYGYFRTRSSPLDPRDAEDRKSATFSYNRFNQSWFLDRYTFLSLYQDKFAQIGYDAVLHAYRCTPEYRMSGGRAEAAFSIPFNLAAASGDLKAEGYTEQGWFGSLRQDDSSGINIEGLILFGTPRLEGKVTFNHFCISAKASYALPLYEDLTWWSGEAGKKPVFEGGEDTSDGEFSRLRSGLMAEAGLALFF